MLVIILVVAIVVATVLTAIAAKHKRFDVVRVPIANSFGLFRNVRVKRIPTDQEITAQITAKGDAHDSSDDLLDPKNPDHAKWLAEHEAPPTDEPHSS